MTFPFQESIEVVLKSHNKLQSGDLIGLPVFWTCWLSTTKKTLKS